MLMQETINVIVATPWLATTVVAVLGLCVGSFLNVVIYRLPRMMEGEWRSDCSILLKDQLNPTHTPYVYENMTLSKPASRCPSCAHKIRWYENVPRFSGLALRGRCSSCGASIGIRYPLVELLTMLASIAVFFRIWSNCADGLCIRSDLGVDCTHRD
jgi:leader peptidase (prepilin peptidase)/N-methyltransferase